MINANDTPGRLAMETDGFWDERRMYEAGQWVFPTLLYDFRLSPEGSPQLPSLARILPSSVVDFNSVGCNEDSRVQSR